MDSLLIDNFAIASFAGVAIVIALVAWLRFMGLPTRWAPLVAVLIGLLLSLANQLAQVYPVVRPWLDAAVVGIMVGLAGSGFYDLGKSFIKPPDDLFPHG